MEKINKTIEKEQKTVPLERDVIAIVLGQEFGGEIKNKKDLYENNQLIWRNIIKNENIFPEKINDLSGLEAIKEICNKISKTKSGFGSSPGLYNLLNNEGRGLDCLSSSMILGTYLEDNGIKFHYVSPIGHIALFVEIDNQTYYVDPRNNKVTEATKYIKEFKSQKDYDIINFDIKPKDKFYSFAIKYKNKEDIMRAVLGNIFVLNELNNEISKNASKRLDLHKQAAESIKEKLNKIDWKKLETFINLYPDFNEKEKELSEKEEQRLKEIGFYNE